MWIVILHLLVLWNDRKRVGRWVWIRCHCAAAGALRNDVGLIALSANRGCRLQRRVTRVVGIRVGCIRAFDVLSKATRWWCSVGRWLKRWVGWIAIGWWLSVLLARQIAQQIDSLGSEIHFCALEGTGGGIRFVIGIGRWRCRKRYLSIIAIKPQLYSIRRLSQKYHSLFVSHICNLNVVHRYNLVAWPYAWIGCCRLSYERPHIMSQHWFILLLKREAQRALLFHQRYFKLLHDAAWRRKRERERKVSHKNLSSSKPAHSDCVYEKWKAMLTPGGRIDSSWFIYCWCLKLNDARIGGIGGSAVGGDNLRKFSSCGRHTSRLTTFAIVRSTSRASCGLTWSEGKREKEEFIFNLWLCVRCHSRWGCGARGVYIWRKCME